MDNLAPAALVEPESAPTARTRRQEIIRLAVVAGVVVVAFVATVIVLNSTLYSAPGFVRGYLGALARHDVAAALQVDGVTTPDGAAETLLAPDALGDLADVRVTGTAALPGGGQRVTVSYDAGGSSATSSFDVSRTTPTLLFFSAWRFDVSPVAVLQITPMHADGFEAGSTSVPAVGGESVAYAALVPSAITLSHDSTYFTAAPETVVADTPGATAAVDVDIRANDDFVTAVQDQLDGLLDDCSTQQVLQPTGCPFGQPIENRIEGLPTWSMVDYPVVTIEPGAETGSWTVPQSEGVAHLVVDVRSLFDGSRSTFDQDVPFRIGYDIVVDEAGRMSITGTSR